MIELAWQSFDIYSEWREGTTSSKVHGFKRTEDNKNISLCRRFTMYDGDEKKEDFDTLKEGLSHIPSMKDIDNGNVCKHCTREYQKLYLKANPHFAA